MKKSIMKLYNEKFESIIKKVEFDVIITDPPYPNFLAEEFNYYEGIIDFLKNYHCPQIIFWTDKEDFVHDWDTKHTWHKQCGTYATTEAIYERNSSSKPKTYSYQKIKNNVDAQMNRDIKTIHPSQKPIRLINELINDFTKEGQVVFDPFAGSGSIGVSCVRYNRGYIGCEINKQYFEIAKERILKEKNQLQLF
jgi:DNA modification methylase